MTARKPLVIGPSGQQQGIQSTDTLQLPAASTTNAPINLPHGTAPAAPADGDVWTTTEGLFVQINGVTGAIYVPSAPPGRPTGLMAATSGP